jgi:hypothetical protein
VCYKLKIRFFHQKPRAIKLAGEVEMFEISEKAGEMIKENFKDKEVVPSIRVVYNEGG